MKPPGTNAGSGSISRLGPQLADHQPRIPRPSLSNASKTQNPNREALRLEAAVPQTKQRTPTRSNRELEACCSPPVGEGVYLPPGLGLGVGWNFGGMRRASDIQNSNREALRLETAITQTKQRTPTRSNRELEACFSASKCGRTFDVRCGGRVYYAPGLALGAGLA
jgi:hypothetical protein